MNVEELIAVIRNCPIMDDNHDVPGWAARDLCDAYEALRASHDAWTIIYDELRAKVEGLEKDAARYRFLRAQHEGPPPHDGATFAVFMPTPDAVSPADIEPVGCDPGELDAAIDAELAKAGGK